MTLAKKGGAEVTQNIVMLGALAAIKGVPMKLLAIKKAMQELVPTKYLDVNKRSFELGFSFIQQRARYPDVEGKSNNYIRK